MTTARNLRINVKRKQDTVPLPTWTVNGTALFSMLAIAQHPMEADRDRYVLKKVTYLTRTVGVDADGTMLLNIFKKRGATQTQLVTSFAVEGLTVDDGTDVTFDAAITLADRTLRGGDVLYGSLVNNSVAIDTNPAAFVQTLTLELEPIDVLGEGFFDSDGEVAG